MAASVVFASPTIPIECEKLRLMASGSASIPMCSAGVFRLQFDVSLPRNRTPARIRREPRVRLRANECGHRNETCLKIDRHFDTDRTGRRIHRLQNCSPKCGRRLLWTAQAIGLLTDTLQHA